LVCPDRPTQSVNIKNKNKTLRTNFNISEIVSSQFTSSTPLKTPTPTPIWKLNGSTRHALMELDQEMPDFADMFSLIKKYF
jgi:hypothetical protein